MPWFPFISEFSDCAFLDRTVTGCVLTPRSGSNKQLKLLEVMENGCYYGLTSLYTLQSEHSLPHN